MRSVFEGDVPLPAPKLGPLRTKFRNHPARNSKKLELHHPHTPTHKLKRIMAPIVLKPMFQLFPQSLSAHSRSIHSLHGPICSHSIQQRGIRYQPEWALNGSSIRFHYGNYSYGFGKCLPYRYLGPFGRVGKAHVQHFIPQGDSTR